MDKKLCDMCGKEIEKEETNLSWSKETLINFKYWSKDFCSKECLLKYLKKIKWIK